MRDIIIVGAGTLGLFGLEIIERLNNFNCIGFLDDSFPHKKEKCGVPILGAIKDIENFQYNEFVIGIGNPIFRFDFFEKWTNMGYSFTTIIDPSCIISNRSTIEQGVIIGPNSSVLQGSLVRSGSCILSYVNINQNVNVGNSCLIGAGVIIGNDAVIGKRCHLGLGTRILKGQKLIDDQEILLPV